jgi:hypothetical protein
MQFFIWNVIHQEQVFTQRPVLMELCNMFEFQHFDLIFISIWPHFDSFLKSLLFTHCWLNKFCEWGGNLVFRSFLNVFSLKLKLVQVSVLILNHYFLWCEGFTQLIHYLGGVIGSARDCLHFKSLANLLIMECYVQLCVLLIATALFLLVNQDTVAHMGQCGLKRCDFLLQLNDLGYETNWCECLQSL